MAETARKQSGESRDYKERFEFRFTVGNNIICQRYFRINKFNPLCLASEELAHTIRWCASLIDSDLKDKTEKYLKLVAPQVFKNEEEMRKYFSVEKNRARMHLGEGIVLREPENAPNYVWGKNNEPVALSEKFDTTRELVNPLTEEDTAMYKFAFCDNGREVCSTVWEGTYPKYVRNSIDLSNKRGKISPDEDPARLSTDAYILYKLVEGKGDIVYKIIKDICYVCSSEDNSSYTTGFEFLNDGKKTEYDNTELQRELRKEYKRLEAYLNEQTTR